MKGFCLETCEKSSGLEIPEPGKSHISDNPFSKHLQVYCSKKACVASLALCADSGECVANVWGQCARVAFAAFGKMREVETEKVAPPSGWQVKGSKACPSGHDFLPISQLISPCRRDKEYLSRNFLPISPLSFRTAKEYLSCHFSHTQT